MKTHLETKFIDRWRSKGSVSTATRSLKSFKLSYFPKIAAKARAEWVSGAIAQCLRQHCRQNSDLLSTE